MALHSSFNSERIKSSLLAVLDNQTYDFYNVNKASTFSLNHDTISELKAIS